MLVKKQIVLIFISQICLSSGRFIVELLGFIPPYKSLVDELVTRLYDTHHKYPTYISTKTIAYPLCFLFDDVQTQNATMELKIKGSNASRKTVECARIEQDKLLKTIRFDCGDNPCKSDTAKTWEITNVSKWRIFSSFTVEISQDCDFKDQSSVDSNEELVIL